MILAIAAVFVMSAAAQAQCSDHKEGKQCKKEQMIQSRTERMVKRYGLDEEQARKLKELNEEYARLMPAGKGGHPGCKEQACPSQQAGKDCNKQSKVDGASGATNRKSCPEKADCEKMQKERMKAHKAYDEKLKKILGSEKFSQYQSDRKQAMERGSRPSCEKGGKPGCGGCSAGKCEKVGEKAGQCGTGKCEKAGEKAGQCGTGKCEKAGEKAGQCGAGKCIAGKCE